MTINNVLIVSDLHCGSSQGLTHPYYTSEATPESAKWLWSRWTDFLAGLPRKIDLLILNGDLVDGPQRRSDGVGLVTTCMAEQTDMAIRALEPLVSRARYTIRTVGTPHHETQHGPLAALDEHFNIEVPSGQRSFVRDINLGGGAILNVKHQPEGEGALYRGTTMDRELLWATITETLHKIPNATHIIRSHLHSHNYLGGFRKEIHMCPCWSLQPAYATNKKYYRWTPDIGGLLMKRNKDGHMGWIIKGVIFPLPTFEAEQPEELS